MLTAERETEYCCISPTKVGEHTSSLNVSVCVPLPVKLVLSIILQIICSYNDRYFVFPALTHLGPLKLQVFELYLHHPVYSFLTAGFNNL